MLTQKFSITCIYSFFIALGALLLFSCNEKTPSDLSKESIIPKPAQVTSAGEYFELNSKTLITTADTTRQMQSMAGYLAGILKPATGFELDVKYSGKAPARGIFLVIDGNKPADESYKLEINRKLITLSSASPAGLFMGIQTLRQLLPAKIEMTSVQEGPWKIATGTITDNPVYAYRGVMLDVSRHFFSVNDVKRFIDLISAYKMNVLHLHLSDDQGWRIEIKSWPNLTVHGGSTQVDGGKGGYYTQEDYSEIVRYSQSRFVTIIPEIDMPGHTNAALASYAELNCNGKATELYTGIRVGFSSFCTKKEITYKFIDDVVNEISALTPGPWFHMGGDESHSTKKEDYIPFVNRVQDIIASHGKHVMGWDDISIGTIKPNTAAQYWSNAKNALAAVSQGAKIVFSPAKKAYLDMKYDKTTKLGQSWA
jgi:hexosaminidase